MTLGRARRVVIRSAAAELYSLPWELVTLKGCGQHLVDRPGCSLSYEWPQETVEHPGPRPGWGGACCLPGRRRAGGVPAPEHVQALQRASQSGDFAFDVQRDVLHRVSLSRLAQLLKDASQEPVSVLHVLCHGAPLAPQETGVYGLSWNKSEDEDGKALVDGGMLAAVLAPHAATLRMVGAVRMPRRGWWASRQPPGRGSAGAAPRGDRDGGGLTAAALGPGLRHAGRDAV